MPQKKGLPLPEIPAELKLEDWWPMEPDKGPPLPKWLNIVWPWYKPPVIPPIYTCPFCGAKFSTPEELNQHIASAHPEQPPTYTCPYCGATFSSQAELDAHIQNQHPPVVYTCPYCGAEFSTEAELNSHILTEHPTPVISAEVVDGFFRNQTMPTSPAWSGWADMPLDNVEVDLTQFGHYLEAGFIWKNNSNVPVTCEFTIWHRYWTMVNNKQKYITEPPFILPMVEPLTIPPAPTGLPTFNYELLCDKFTPPGSTLDPGQKGFVYTPVFEVSRRWNYIYVTLKVNGQEMGTWHIGGWGGY